MFYASPPPPSLPLPSTHQLHGHFPSQKNSGEKKQEIKANR